MKGLQNGFAFVCQTDLSNYTRVIEVSRGDLRSMHTRKYVRTVVQLKKI